MAESKIYKWFWEAQRNALLVGTMADEINRVSFDATHLKVMPSKNAQGKQMTPAEMKHIMTHRASALRREQWLEEIIELLRIDADGDAYQAISDSDTNDGREVICLD